MPNNLLDDAVRMGVAGGLVFLIAAPCAGVGWALCRRYGFPILTPWRRSSTVWSDIELFALFGLFLFLPGLGYDLLRRVMGEQWAMSHELRQVWASVLSIPCVLAAGGTLWSLRHRTSHFSRRLPGQMVLGFATWPAIHIGVFAVYFLCLSILTGLGGEPEKHPFSQIVLDEMDRGTLVLLGLLACVLAPLVEEFLFRGVLFDWSTQRQLHPWVILVLAILFAMASGQVYAVAFMGLLSVAYVGWRKTVRGLGFRTPSRVVNAVYGTSALFAAVHAGVWPSPIPLFVLGLCLGVLRTRTGGIAAGFVLHGLFNAVSFVYLLRSPA